MAHQEPHRLVAGPFFCEKLADLPRLLYHIEHADSQATHSGPYIEAADRTPKLLTWSELEARAEKHQNWYNRRPSCFISTFKTSNHARNWGLQRKGPVYIHTIDTTLLPQSGQWVLRMVNANEYLFFDRIPSNAIVSREEIKPAEQTVTASRMTSAVDKFQHLTPWAISRCDLPPRLYFIKHAGSQSISSIFHVTVHDGVFVDETREVVKSNVHNIQIRDFSELCERIAEHVNWDQRRKTMFVSAFGERKQAIEWGMQRDGPVEMYEINTSWLPADQLVFQADKLTANCSKNEFLFLQQIPSRAITKVELLKATEPLREPLVLRTYTSSVTYRFAQPVKVVVPSCTLDRD